MTPITKPAEQAVANFRAGCSCCQAVLTAYGAPLGLDQALAMRLATGLSGGLRTGEVCGAVAGACLVLGLRHGQGEATDTAAKLKTYEQVREFQRRFQARHGFTRCKDLLGCDVGTEEGLKQARERDLFHTLCPKLVEDAAAILDEML